MCPLGDKRGGGIVEDALGLISTTSSKLTVRSYSALKDKGGVLVFDGVGTSALPVCSVELYSKYASVFKAATGVSAPGYSSGLAYYVVSGEIVPFLCQGQRDTIRRMHL